MESWRAELYHHGIKGMRWGVRRFQNYDGTYTKKGLARYNESEAQYNKAHENLRNLKAARKSGQQVSKHDIKVAKQNVKLAKNKMSKNYDQLKLDKRADEGKKLYAEGARIRQNSKVSKMVATAGYIATGARMLQVHLKTGGDVKLTAIEGTKVALGASFISTLVNAKFEIENSKLRAYYGHSGKKE